MKTAREMGIRTVAVYSDADEASRHAEFADEAVAIGAPEPAASYLSIDRILEAAAATGADAIHPGYGFLSENADFSERCREAGLIFLGPPPEAMRRLGAKIDAKQLAVAQGVPVTPGYFEPGATAQTLLEEARKIGFPVMLKASAGGGGRGMRVVRHESDLVSEFEVASSEALQAFGSGEMMVEKLVEQPRHVEVQILADQHGNVAPLFERECSVQRRHQKLIEEAPSPIMTDELWRRMAESAVKLAKAAGYVGAGTVEFLVDPVAHAFYFLEVNARLQVEHPVTEAITGLDLVRWQIEIAQGASLADGLPGPLLAGDRSAIHGHAVEVRVVAEDPAKGFLPSIGKLIGWAEPQAPGVRVDTGFGVGREISRYYDSLIAKVICHAQTRADALSKTRAALLDFHILGVRQNIAYILDVIDHPEFKAGTFDTGFLGREFAEWAPPTEIPDALGAILGQAQAATTGVSGAPQEAHTAWAASDRFRVCDPD